MNIRVHLSSVAGSDEKTTEAIERALQDRQPFGLKCQWSMVIFIPHTYKAYWIWGDGELGPDITSDNLKSFVDQIKIQYLSHKDLVSTDELLGIAKILKYEQHQKRLGLFSGKVLPESGQQAGPMDAGSGRIFSGEDGRN